MSMFAKAILFSLGAALISGVNGFLTKSALTAVGDPVVFTFLKNVFVAIVFLAIFVWRGKVNEIKTASPRDRWMLLAIGIIGGGIPFLLYFIGLSMIPAATAVFIQKTLFVWVAVLAVPFLGERVGWLHACALGLLLFGVFLFQIPALQSFGKGETLVFLATLLWAVENIVAKKSMARLSSFSAMTARMVVGSTVIFLWLVATGKVGLIATLPFAAWEWIALTGLLLTGYVRFWYRALSLAPATFVASLLVPAAFITGALSSLFVTGVFSFAQVVGGCFLTLGIAFLSWATFPVFSRSGNSQARLALAKNA